MQENLTPLVAVVVGSALIAVTLAFISERRSKRAADLAQSRFSR